MKQSAAHSSSFLKQFWILLRFMWDGCWWHRSQSLPSGASPNLQPDDSEHTTFRVKFRADYFTSLSNSTLLSQFQHTSVFSFQFQWPIFPPPCRFQVLFCFLFHSWVFLAPSSTLWMLVLLKSTWLCCIHLQYVLWKSDHQHEQSVQWIAGVWFLTGPQIFLFHLPVSAMLFGKAAVPSIKFQDKKCLMLFVLIPICLHSGRSVYHLVCLCFCCLDNCSVGNVMSWTQRTELLTWQK